MVGSVPLYSAVSACALVLACAYFGVNVAIIVLANAEKLHPPPAPPNPPTVAANWSQIVTNFV